MLLGHGSEFSAVPSRTQPSPVLHPSRPSLSSPLAALLPPRSGYHQSHPTAPPVRLFLFRGCEHDATHGVQSSPGVRLHSLQLPIYTYIHRTPPAEASPVRGSSRVTWLVRRSRGGEKKGLGRAHDLVLAGTRSRTFCFRGQRFRIGAYAE